MKIYHSIVAAHHVDVKIYHSFVAAHHVEVFVYIVVSIDTQKLKYTSKSIRCVSVCDKYTNSCARKEIYIVFFCNVQ